jgi:hypothetical protein
MLDWLGEVVPQPNFARKQGSNRLSSDPPLPNPERRGTPQPKFMVVSTPTTDGCAVGQCFALLRGGLRPLPHYRDGRLLSATLRGRLAGARQPLRYRRR